jgi:hypothetical protein
MSRGKEPGQPPRLPLQLEAGAVPDQPEPAEIMAVASTDLQDAQQTLLDLGQEWQSEKLYEMHLRRMTRLLHNVEQALGNLAVHPNARGHEYQLTLQGYMTIVAGVEETLLRIDAKREAGKRGEVVPVAIDEDERAAIALLRISEQRGVQLPYWIVDYLSGFVSDLDIVRYMDQFDDVEGDAHLDEQYEQAMQRPSSHERRRQLGEISLGMLLRAVRLAGNDPADQEGNRHRAVNTFDALADEWQVRYPPVARRYELLRDHVPQMVEVLDTYFYQPAPEKPSSVAPEPMEQHDLARLGKIMVDATNLIYLLSQRFREQGMEIEDRLEAKLTLASQVLDSIHDNPAVSDDEYNRLVDHYMLLVMEVEDLINDVDLRLQEKDKTPITVEWEWTTDKGIYAETLYRLNADLELDLPDWMIEFLAGIIFQHGEIRAYMREPYDEAAETEFDTRYEELNRLHGFERRREAWELSIRLLMRAVKRQAADPNDSEGNVHRTGLVLDQVREEWEERFPPVAEKYAELRENLPQVIDLLVTAYRR